MQNLCDSAADLGIEHAERELGMVPRSFARKKSSLSAKLDKIVTDYSNERAFFITGVAKEEILEKARGVLLNYFRRNPSGIPGDDLVVELKTVLRDWLPEGVLAQRATTIARTNISDLYNFSKYQLFTSDMMRGWVEAFMYSAIMDGRTTPLCRELHGRIFTAWDINGYIPPNHFNCRSTLLPITKLESDWWQEIYYKQGPIRNVPREGFL